jgi:hypothetical protein
MISTTSEEIGARVDSVSASRKSERADLIKEFLQRTLAGGPIAAEQLEAEARAAALLGAAQHITNAKLFRRAKNDLHIRSTRVGGRNGDWYWVLPAVSVSSSIIVGKEIVKDVPSERLGKDVPEVAREVGPSDGEDSVPVPQVDRMETPATVSASARRLSTWKTGIAGLHRDRPFPSVPTLRWGTFIDDCKAFMDLTGGWADRAARLRWDAFDLFASHPARPLDYLTIAGLLWLVNGGRIVGLREGWAMIHDPLSGKQTTFTQRRTCGIDLVLPWTAIRQ